MLNDAFKLAESRHLSYSIPLSMTEYLTNEKSLIPWKTLYSEFVSMEHSLEKTETYPLYRKVSIFIQLTNVTINKLSIWIYISYLIISVCLELSYTPL